MLNAKIQLENASIPDCSYPHPPYRFIGRGITLIYEIPFNRVIHAIPSVFDPDPGKGKIWFMVNFHDWQKFYPLSDPGFKHSFFESYYKFSVKYQSSLGDYPIKLYLTSQVGIASGIELYGYPKYPAEMRRSLVPPSTFDNKFRMLPDNATSRIGPRISPFSTQYPRIALNRKLPSPST